MIVQVSPGLGCSDRAPNRHRWALRKRLPREAIEVQTRCEATAIVADPPLSGYTEAARAAKVAALKRAVAIGAYSVHAELLAERLIRQALVDVFA
jgi:anti-sigma28 factor (negative regulator of flagellin synthesis)